MGGHGVSGRQLDKAVGSQANLAATGTANQNALQGTANTNMGATNAGYGALAQNGLPFYRNLTDYSSGTIAQAFAPQRAQILRSTGQYANMPSGYRDALLAKLAAAQGQAFDQSLTQNMFANQQAKMQGLAGLQGNEQIAQNAALGYGAQAGNANQSILYGPRKPGVLGTIGGAANQLMQDALQRPAAAAV